jgi:hypothetical protein
MNTQDTELRLICNDIDDLLSVLLTWQSHELAGYLLLALFPTISFVVEESNNYFLSRNLQKLNTPLLDSHKTTIKKSRALIKLFNDTEGGSSGLIKFLNLFQEKSSLWMNAGKSGLIGSISKLLQPDIGIYFLDENPIYMTTLGFSAMGKTKNEIELLSEHDFKDFSEQSRAFGEAIGTYFGTIMGFMSLYGITSNYKSLTTTPLSINITHNDFHSETLYKRVADDANLKDTNLAQVFFLILNQVNVAYYLLPNLFPLKSNLLLRLQFLTAYHTISSLSEIQNNIDLELAQSFSSRNILTTIPNVRKIRNILAHYGLGEGKKYIGSNQDILSDVVQGVCGMPKSKLLEYSNTQLREISEWSQTRFSKSKLKGLRALFGDHT